MKKLFCYAAFSASLLFIAFNSHSQFLDPTFGTGGKAGPFNNGFFPAEFGEDIKSAQSMAVDNNGKILIAGHQSNGTNQDLAIMRLNANGTPDVTYGTNGVTKFNDLGGDEYATAIAFNAPGAYSILAGYRLTTDVNGQSGDIVVMQINVDGSINNSFGQQGVRIIDEAGNEEVYSIAFGSDGGGTGIYLGGFTNPDFIDFNPARGHVWRMSNSGGTVNGFRVDFAGATCHVYSLAVDANGNILAGGDNIGGGSRFAIARFFPNGSFDNSFDGDGKAFINVGNTPAGITQIKLQTDGKILAVSGFFNLNTSTNGSVVARLNADGTLDNNFSGGYVLIPFNYTGGISSPRSLALQNDGKIIVSGLLNDATATSTNFGFARLNTDGSIDNSFGNSGIYSFDFGNGSIDVNNAILLQADGKLLAGTMSKDANSDRFFAGLIRLQFTEPLSCAITGPAQLCNGAVIAYDGPVGPYTYNWTITGNGSFANGTATDGPSVQVRAGGGGASSFVLSLAVTNSIGEQSTCSKTVTLTQETCIISGPSQACANVETLFTGPVNLASYNWTVQGTGAIKGLNTGSSVTVISSGGSYILSLFATGGCIYQCQKDVLVNPPVPCNITGPASVNALSTGNVYTSPAGTSSYNWSISGSGGSIVGVANGQSVTVSANASGTYTLILTTTFNGCNSSPNCQFPVTVVPAVPACTYTQDFYSKKNNKGCSNAGTVSVTQIMLNAFGPANLKVFGSSATNRLFTLYRSDINNGNIFKMLPGFDGAQAIAVDAVPPLVGASYDDKTTWPLVPIPITGMQKGQISNSLLSQLMTLWFNLGNNPLLGTIPIDLNHSILTTRAQTACGSNTPTGTSADFNLPTTVVSYVDQQASYSNDVNGLFQLANDVLGGVVISITPTEAKNAVEVINNAFNGCRILAGTSSTQGAFITQMNRNEIQQQTITGKLSVTAFPNPYNKQFSLRINAPVSGMATIEFYDINGAKVYQMRKAVIRDTNNIISYAGPYHSGSLLYKVNIGSYRAGGFVVRPN